MSELKVEGYEDLVRDTESTAIVNKDKNVNYWWWRKSGWRNLFFD